MQFLKTLFWALLIGLGAAFAFNNWVPVEIRLWGGLIAEVNLPLLLVVTFLLGLVPMLIGYHAMRWRLRQRLTATERALSDLRAVHAAPAEPVVVESVPTPVPTPPAPVPPAPPAPGDGPLFDSDSSDEVPKP